MAIAAVRGDLSSDSILECLNNLIEDSHLWFDYFEMLDKIPSEVANTLKHRAQELAEQEETL